MVVETSTVRQPGLLAVDEALGCCIRSQGCLPVPEKAGALVQSLLKPRLARDMWGGLAGSHLLVLQ